jgi:two-component system, NarL family, nitrate/nitrite response regulator NarL
MITTNASALDKLPADAALPSAISMPQAVHFSPRERQIVSFITMGCSNREVAARMGLRTQTVKNHLCRIYRKLGVPNRVQLAVFAVGHGSRELRS